MFAGASLALVVVCCFSLIVELVCDPGVPEVRSGLVALGMLLDVYK